MLRLIILFTGCHIFCGSLLSANSAADNKNQIETSTEAPKVSIQTKKPSPKPATKKAKVLPPTQLDDKKRAQLISTLVNAVQNQYNKTKAATFDFTQLYENKLVNTKQASKGNVQYSRAGGDMRWEYIEPADKQKIFFIHGNNFVFYNKSDKTAYEHNCFQKETLSSAVPFLLGTGKLTESFTISFMDNKHATDNITWLTLVPKEKNSPVKKLNLKVNKQGNVLEVLIEDPSGGTNHFIFTTFKNKESIPDSNFKFVKPHDVQLQPVPFNQCPEPALPTKPVLKKPVVQSQGIKK